MRHVLGEDRGTATDRDAIEGREVGVEKSTFVTLMSKAIERADDLGDRFIALQKGRTQQADDGGHFGLIVDDKEVARDALKAAGVTLLDGRFLDFRDPWGNRIEIVGYDNIQFTKAPNVLRGMGLTRLIENESAKKELAEKGMAADLRE